MIDLNINEAQRKKNIERCREKGIILPTYAQMRDPALIPEAIDLEIGPGLQHGISTPRSIDFAVQLVRLMSAGFKAGIEKLNVLGATAFGDKQGIGGVDHNQIINANGTNHAFAALDKTIGNIVQHGFAFDAVAARIRRSQITQGVPRTNVAPADTARNNGDAVRLFHHRKVDRSSRRRRRRAPAMARAP